MRMVNFHDKDFSGGFKIAQRNQVLMSLILKMKFA